MTPSRRNGGKALGPAEPGGNPKGQSLTEQSDAEYKRRERARKIAADCERPFAMPPSRAELKFRRTILAAQETLGNALPNRPSWTEIREQADFAPA